MSPSNNPGPPPVGRSAVAPPTMNAATQNYLTVVDTLKANNGAEAKSIRAMFGGDKALMDRFLAVAFSALAGNSKVLQDATPMSLIQAIKDAASLGLEPMTQDAAIVVYAGNAKLLVQWRGYVKRIRNSREVTDLDCQLVYENDFFELELGTNPNLRHVPFLPVHSYKPANALDDDDDAQVATRGGYRGVYAWALMPSGKYIIEWMTSDDINYVRDRWGNTRSRNNEPLPWETSWGEMARKTAIRRLAKRLPSAAVDKLLALESQHDQELAATREQLKATSDELSEVRNLALRAVGVPQLGEGASETSSEAPGADEGQGGAPVATEPTPDADGPAEGVEEAPSPVIEPEEQVEPDRSPELAPDPGADPNVSAAMALSDEQEQLRQYRQRQRR